jgi:hypothetical protein
VGHVQSKQWLDVGWRVASINLSQRFVRFSRIEGRQRAYIDFYNVVDDELRKLRGFEHLAVSPDGGNWHAVKGIAGGGRTLASLNFSFGRGGIFRVELYIDTGDREINKDLFDALHSERKKIEEEVGHELEWQRLDTRRACRISRVFEGRIIDSSESLQILAEKAGVAMEALTRVMEPRVISIGQHLLAPMRSPIAHSTI